MWLAPAENFQGRQSPHFSPQFFYSVVFCLFCLFNYFKSTCVLRMVITRLLVRINHSITVYFSPFSLRQVSLAHVAMLAGANVYLYLWECGWGALFLTSRGVTLFFAKPAMDFCNIAILGKLNRESLVHRDIRWKENIIECLAPQSLCFPQNILCPPNILLAP